MRDRPNDRPITSAASPAASAARIARSRSRRAACTQADCGVRRSRPVSPPQMPSTIRLVMAYSRQGCNRALGTDLPGGLGALAAFGEEQVQVGAAARGLLPPARSKRVYLTNGIGGTSPGHACAMHVIRQQTCDTSPTVDVRQVP